ncbi:MAG: hypothetical protein IPI39_12345 [Candidatus Obscuribacter sp.]|nr:hypothetical protein [Candidatus Obscuribacter sp.]
MVLPVVTSVALPCCIDSDVALVVSDARGADHTVVDVGANLMQSLAGRCIGLVNQAVLPKISEKYLKVGSGESAN